MVRLSELVVSYTVTHGVISRSGLRCIAERAVRMPVVPMIAVVPVTIHRPAMPVVPPMGIEIPVVRRSPARPVRIPEPVVDVRTVDVHRLDNVVRAIDIFVTYHLCGDLPCSFIFLDVDGCNVLEDILCQHSLYNDQVFVVGGCFHYSEVVDYTVTVKIKIGESRVRVIEKCFELLNVLHCSEERSHRFQVERLAYIFAVGRDGYRLVCPCTPTNCGQQYE